MDLMTETLLNINSVLEADTRDPLFRVMNLSDCCGCYFANSDWNNLRGSILRFIFDLYHHTMLGFVDSVVATRSQSYEHQ